MSRSKDRALRLAKEARGGGQFLPLNLDVLHSQALANLSPYGAKLLLDIASQWRLGRNGDASAAFEKVMRARGWRSKSTLQKAIKELCASGLIVLTRQGSLHQCSLFALGWLAIDDCGGKLDMQATTRPINAWRDMTVPNLKVVSSKSSSPPRVPTPIKNVYLGTPRGLESG